MERVTNLTDTVKREVADYAWDEEQSKAYFMANEERHVYSVLIVPVKKPQDALTIIVARVTDDMVIIETDLTDKPLFDALLKAGIPRSHIIRAYRGETTPSL